METGTAASIVSNVEKQTINTVLIVGPPRTGTTLLGYLLAGGKDVLYLSEPFIMIIHNRNVIKKIDRLILKKRFKVDPPKIDDIHNWVQYFKKIAASNKCHHLLIKETFRLHPVLSSSQAIEKLISEFDSSIAIIRHPYNTVFSTIKHLRPWCGIIGTFLRIINPEIYKFKDETEIVKWSCKNWLSFYKKFTTQNSKLVKYEDLVNNTESELQRVSQICGIRFDKNMLDFNYQRLDFYMKGDGRVKNRKTKFIDIKPSVQIKDSLKKEYRHLIKQICGTAAAEIGYVLQ